MESVKAKTSSYIYLTLLIVLSSFEFFFREKTLLLLLYSIAIVDYVIRGKHQSTTKFFSIFVASYITILTLHAFLGYNSGINPIIDGILTVFGLLSISSFLGRNFIKIYIEIIYIIAVYSLVIYVLCLNETVYKLFFNFASFDSLNLERAVFDGGGRNFIIYNFQSDNILDTIGFRRNCGPFWEPGMFAVYLIIALFFNIFLERQKIKLCNTILILALASTFSTGGLIAGIILILFYVLKIKLKSHLNILFIPALLFVAFQIYNLEYVGGKTNEQFETAQVGSDKTRYGAFLTQIKMIETSPIIGGETLSRYAETKTLASGTLLPFVYYGITFGCLYFLVLFNSCINISKRYNRPKVYGLELFVLILIISFSQTVLFNTLIFLILIFGTIKPRIYIKNV